MNYKKIIASALVIGSLFYSTNVSAITNTKISNPENTTDAVSITTIRKVLKYAYKIIKIGDYYNSGLNVSRYPQGYVETADLDTFTTGAINFNNKLNSGYGSTVYKQILATQYGQKIRMIGINQQTFVGRMSFTILKNGNPFVSPPSVKPYTVYEKVVGSGNYLLGYTVGSKETWSGFTAFYHYASGNNSPYVIKNKSDLNAVSINGESNNVLIEEKGNQLALKRKTINKNRIFINNKSFLTFNDLKNEFYDKESNLFVHQSINFNLGDSIIVKDEIIESEYDFKSDETTLYFTVDDNMIESIVFSGNITNKYKSNQEISLKFKLLPMFEDNLEYQIIDHNYYHQKNNSAPMIDDYIVQDNISR